MEVVEVGEVGAAVAAHGVAQLVAVHVGEGILSEEGLQHGEEYRVAQQVV